MTTASQKNSPPAPVSRRRIGPVDVIFGANGGKYPDANFASVVGSDSRAIIDLPLVSREAPDDLERADVVLLTHVHEDHTAGLSLVANTPVHVHRADVEAIRSLEGYATSLGYSAEGIKAACELATTKFHFSSRPDANSFESGAIWDLGGVRIRAIHAPGHTAGHCVFLIEPDNIAFIGDIDLTGFGPYYGDMSSSLADFRSTIAAVREIPAVCWVTSHHKGVVANRGTFLEMLGTFANALERRETALIEAMRSGPKTLEDLVRQRFVYPKGYANEYVDDVERRMISLHLDEFEREGRVFREQAVYSLFGS